MIKIASKITFAVLICLSAGACGESGGAVLSDINFYQVAKDATSKYPDMSPMDARKRFAQDKFNEMYLGLETNDQKRALAASFYLGYSMLNGRAVPAYCQEMNLDLSEFSKGFRRQNRREEMAFESVLEANGMSREDAWEGVERQAMSAAKNELMAIGGLSKGSWGVCKELQDNPHIYAPQASFAASFPSISRVLNSTG